MWEMNLKTSWVFARYAFFCILFSLEHGRLGDWVIAEFIFLQLSSESNASNFEFIQLL